LKRPIFASVTIAVMLTTTMVVKGFADGFYTLERTAAEGDKGQRNDNLRVIGQRPAPA
jgi:hypothetical protein